MANAPPKNSRESLRQGDKVFEEYGYAHKVKTPKAFFGEYNCPVCADQFVYRRQLALHMRSEHLTQGVSCKICGKFFKKWNFQRHMDTHLDKRPFQCPMCPHKSRSLLHLRVHVRVHSTHRAFQCTRCEKSFRHASELTRHGWKNHDDPSPYRCTPCNVVYQKRVTFAQHMRAKHTDECTFKCEGCDELFYYKVDLTRHYFSCEHAPKQRVGWTDPMCRSSGGILPSVQEEDPAPRFVKRPSVLKSAITKYLTGDSEKSMGCSI